MGLDLFHPNKPTSAKEMGQIILNFSPYTYIYLKENIYFPFQNISYILLLRVYIKSNSTKILQYD